MSGENNKSCQQENPFSDIFCHRKSLSHLIKNMNAAIIIPPAHFQITFRLCA